MIPATETRSERELERSVCSPLLHGLYRVLRADRRWRVARVILQFAQRLEGGACRSRTARELMSRHHGVSIGAYSYGDCFDPAAIPPGVAIGRYVSIAPGVRFHLRNHPIDRLSTHPFFYDPRLGVVSEEILPRRELVIGHDTWIGRNAIILPGCSRIGIGAVIGAGSIVTRDVPDFAIVAGNPARVLRWRFDAAVCEQVRASQWWDRPIDELKHRLPEFLEAVPVRPTTRRAAVGAEP